MITPKPLGHIKVLELTQMVAAPTCGSILQSLGAEVTKVETLHGDLAKRMGPSSDAGSSVLWESVNRDKDVQILDFRDRDAVEEIRGLVASSDVLVTNIGLSTRKSANLDFESVKRSADSPIIYVELSAFSGSSAPGTDSLIQAHTGIVSVTGPAGEGGYRTAPPVVDVAAGVWCAFGVMVGLLEARLTGKSQFVKATLEDVAIYLQYPYLAIAHALGNLPPLGNESVFAPTLLVRASDGRIALSVLGDKHWRRFVTLFDLDADDERFKTGDGRLRHQHQIAEIIGSKVATETCKYWLEQCQAVGIPVARVRDYEEVLSDKSYWTRGMFEEVHIDGQAVGLATALPIDFGPGPMEA